MMIICMRERKVKVKSGKKDLCFNALLAGLLSTIEVVGINPFGMGFMAALVIERELSLLERSGKRESKSNARRVR